MPKFHLEKLYADCIDAKGNCLIVYSAMMKLLFFKLHYSAIIFSDEQGLLTESFSFKKLQLPRVNDDLALTLPALQLTGKWSKAFNPVKQILYTNPKQQKLEWNCHHPHSFANIDIAGFKYSGLGYAETLTLPFSPFKLPIDVLGWGRFLSEEHSVIWINWQGKQPLNKVFYNGQLYEDGIFEDARLLFGKGSFQLSFEQPVTIIKRKLSSVLDSLPLLKLFFSKRILHSEEHKCKSLSSFSFRGNIISRGYALYETVNFSN